MKTVLAQHEEKTKLQKVVEWAISHYYVFTTIAMVLGFILIPMTKAFFIVFVTVLVTHAVGEFFHWSDHSL
jgi:hypothetical protein